MTNEQFAQKLRAIAQVYEDNPDIPQLHDLVDGQAFVFCHSKESFTQTVRAFGPGRKGVDDDGLIFWPSLTDGLNFQIYGFRSTVCERVQVGTKVLPAEPEQVIPAKPFREVPVYEYNCKPFLQDQDGPDGPVAESLSEENTAVAVLPPDRLGEDWL